ncbi:MAG: alpha/beta hydrolase [Ginsengibacter sp.]
MENAGVKKEIIQNFLDLHHLLIKEATSVLNTEEYKNKVAESYKNWKEKQSAETLNTLIKGTDEQVIKGMQNQYGAFHTKWWRFFLMYDPAKDLEKLTIPVLALNGEKDRQVDPKTNLPAIESALKKSKSRNYKTIELPGLNHLFQHCTQCTLEEYGILEETFSPEALKIMGDWIKEVVKE